MNKLAEKQQEYEHLMTRYLKEADRDDGLVRDIVIVRNRIETHREQEDRLMMERLRCKEKMGGQQTLLTELAYEIRDLRADESSAV